MKDPIFQDTIGHEPSLVLLSHAKDKPAHAYLFTGNHGLGKTHIAERFAALLLNISSPKSLDAHPDFLRIECEEGKKSLSIKQARALIERMQLTSARGGRRVALVRQADLWTEEAGNALLKSLEEPMPGITYLFIAEAPEQLPATLRSRIVTLRFDRVSIPLIAQALEKETGVSKEQAAFAAMQSRGRPGIAKQILENLSTWEEQKKRVQTTLHTLLNQPLGVQCQTLEQVHQRMEGETDSGEAWRNELTALMNEIRQTFKENPKETIRLGQGLIHAWHLSRTTLSPRLALEWAAVKPYLIKESIPSFLRTFTL